MTQPLPEPVEVVYLVDEYVDDAHRKARTYDNVALLDDGETERLHQVAAEIYALGFAVGRTSADHRHRNRQARRFDAEREAAQARAAEIADLEARLDEATARADAAEEGLRLATGRADG